MSLPAYVKGPLFERIKGLLLAPAAEWEAIDEEDRSVAELYRYHIALLAAIPPVAGFLNNWLFHVSQGKDVAGKVTFGAALMHAVTQYVLTLPALFIVAFVLSMAAPYFEGKSDDRRSLTLIAYSFTPAWLASLFTLIPGLRWLDILAFYGAYLFYLGLPRMLAVKKDNADIFTLIALATAAAASALHGWLVHLIAPLA